MSGFSGINQFGSLTVNGKKITFEEFDKNNDNQISQEEYNSVLKEIKLDSVDLSTVDKDNDKTISKEEFALWEQKIQMQDAINALSATISRDFAGKTNFLPKLTESLRDYIEEFATEYQEDVSKMAEAFKKALPNKYQEIKTSILANDPSTIQSKVLDDIYSELTSDTGDRLSDTTAKRIAKELETEANKFAKTYTGNNFETDLKTHLNEYMNKSDATKLENAATTFKNNANSFGAMIDNGGELTQLKEYAKEFLTEALNAGVTVKLAGTTIKTTAAINTALKKFSDGEELKSAIEDIIAGLDTKTLKEKLIQEEETKALEAENKKFTDIKGSEYTVNTSLIDYSQIEGYFDDSDVTVNKKKKTAELKKQVTEKMYEQLEPLKAQLKTQIQEMLAAKGIPFEKVEQVFENVYSQSFSQTMDAEGMISCKNRTAFRRGKASINVKECVDQFITNFNTNIAAAIDKMNASDKDFDTVDLDMSVLGTDENGNQIETTNNDDILKAYQTGTLLTTKKHGADYYIKIAEQIIDGLKAQMLTKARNMCKANDVEFDISKFNTMFNNAKSLAVNSAVTGSDSKNSSAGTIAAGSGGAAVAGAAATAGTATEVIAGVSASAWTCSSAWATVGTLTIPAVGWAVGGAILVGGVLASIFGGKSSSQSTLDTRALVDGFTEQFSTSFSEWVKTEKAEAKNKK